MSSMDGGNAVTADRAGGVAEWLSDGLLAVGVTLVVTLFIAADVDGSGADGFAYLWAVGLGGLMLVRRRYPLLVVALSVVGLISYHAAGYPPIGVSAPVAAAVFSAAEFGRLAGAVIASLSAVGVSLAYRLGVGQDPAYVLAFELPGHLLLLGAAVALGDSVRSRRQAQRRAEEVAQLLEERYGRQAEERVTQERLAIARDLHDSIGQSMAVVSLHARVAEEAVGTDDAAVTDALRVITRTTGDTIADLRRTVTVLRAPGRDGHPVVGIADLDTAVDPARQAGIAIETVVEVDRDLPAPIEAAVYRIVQESITNVVRHSGADRAWVAVTSGQESVHVRVVDDGRPPRAGGAGSAGHGIRGMRERAEALGGVLTAERTATGFEVHARLPVAVAS